MNRERYQSTLYPVLKLVKVMRAVLFLVFLMLVGMVAVAGTNTTTTNVTSTQLQQIAQMVPPPPSNFMQEVLYYIALAYNYLVAQIQTALQHTILKSDPQIASTYANIIAWLTSLTALYIILVVIEVVRKFIGYIIILGWIFIIALLFFAK